MKKVDVVALARTLATEVAERHLQLWDENPHYERAISAWVLPATSTRTIPHGHFTWP